MGYTKESNQKLFLATTALEEFWDTSKPIVFLSEACLRYSRKEIWEKFDYQIFKSPLEDRIKFKEAYDLANEIYERFLILLSKSLNSLHNIDKSINFWRIFIGPWLMHYAHIIYERYICIESVFNHYPNITTMGLSVDEFVIPRDFSDFLERIIGDIYNLQIYSKILTLLGKDFPTNKPKAIQPSFEECYRITQQNKIKKYIKRLIKNLSPVIIKNSYFPSPSVELELFIKTKGKVFFDHDNSFVLPKLSVDIKMRNELNKKMNCDFSDCFQKLLINLLPFDIPMVYLEGFKIINQRYRNLSPRPKIIVTSESWYFDELFKLWAADCSEEGTTLIGIQHGSNYGIASIIPQENHELRITSRFYSWGWDGKSNFSIVKPFSAPRLMNRKIIAADNKKDGILLITNSMPRYFYRFQDFRNYDNNNYFEWQQRFFNTLNNETRKKLKIRLYMIDYGCDYKERWLDLDQTISLDDLSLPFLESLENCRLSIHDHLGNTYLESLAMNKPTILFWDPKVFEIRKEASEFFEKLHQASILYYNPEEAANTVCEVYDDIEGWWLDTQRQRAREYFCNQYAHISKNAVNLWSSEFVNIINAKKND